MTPESTIAIVCIALGALLICSIATLVEMHNEQTRRIRRQRAFRAPSFD